MIHTKEEYKEVILAIKDMWLALTPKKRKEFAGELNFIFMFLEAEKREAPTKIFHESTADNCSLYYKCNTPEKRE